LKQQQQTQQLAKLLSELQTPTIEAPADYEKKGSQHVSVEGFDTTQEDSITSLGTSAAIQSNELMGVPVTNAACDPL